MKNNAFVGFDEKLAAKTEEKQSLRQTGMFIGLALIITVAIEYFFATMFVNIAALFGVDGKTAALLIGNPVINRLLSLILSVIMFTFPFLIIISGCGLKTDKTVRLGRPKKDNFIFTLLLGLGFCGFANVASNLMFELLRNLGINIDPVGPSMKDGTVSSILVFISAGIIAPLVEEFAMRGVVLGSLRSYGDRFAIFASALIFGILHGNLYQMPYAFIVGLILGFAVVKTGSLWTGIIIHAINNICASAFSLIGENVSAELSMLLNLSFFAVCILCGFASLLFYKPDSETRELLPKGETVFGTKKSLGILFTSPMIIIYLVLVAVEIIINV